MTQQLTAYASKPWGVDYLVCYVVHTERHFCLLELTTWLVLVLQESSTAIVFLTLNAGLCWACHMIEVLCHRSTIGVCRTAHYLEQDWEHGSVPVIGHNNTVLARAEGQGSQGFYGCLVEQHKALLVVRVVSTRPLAIQLAASLAPHLLLQFAVGCKSWQTKKLLSL